jgi:hypothetical protein
MGQPKIVIGPSGAWLRFAVYAALAWVTCGLATIGSPLERLAALSKDAYVCSFALRALTEEGYCSSNGLQCGSWHQELSENEFRSDLLLTLQGRS